MVCVHCQTAGQDYADDVNAVVLLDDNVTTVKENGDIVHHNRRALRILRPETRTRDSIMEVGYNSYTKVNYLRGWSITSKGQEYETKSSDIVERTSPPMKFIRTEGKGGQGGWSGSRHVVGFEYNAGASLQISGLLGLQESDPVERSHYELHLAPGWRVKSDWQE